LLKNTSPVRLFQAIVEVSAGGAPMTSVITQKVLKKFCRQSSVFPKEFNNLSNREEKF
jgi:DNA-binding NarL/FixJ family response regulator